MQFKKACINGLRPKSDMDTNAPYFETYTNLLATERGAKLLPTITIPAAISAISPSFPHPRLLRQDRVCLLADASALYTFDQVSLTKSAITTYSAQNPGTTRATSGTGPWHLAAFQDVWFATNGTCMAFSLPSNTSNKVVITDSSNAPTLAINAVANHDNRLVLGGCSGNAVNKASSTDFAAFYDVWLHSEAKDCVTTEDDDFDTAWVIFSPPGGADNEVPFVAMTSLLGAPGINSSTQYVDKFQEMVHGWVESGQMGMYPCRFTGEIMHMKEHNGALIVYGKEGVSRLRMTERGYTEEKILGTGISYRGAVGGNDQEHLFVTSKGEVHFLGERGATYPDAQPLGNGLYRLDYSEYITATSIVSHDPVEGYFWITRTGGVNCFVLSRTGLSKSAAVDVLSFLRVAGSTTPIGVGTLASDPQAVTLLTHPFDDGKREIQEVQFVDVTLKDTATDVADRCKVQMLAKLYKHNNFTTFTAVNTDGRGTARVSQSGSLFQIKLTAADRTKIEIDDIYTREGKGKPSMSKWL